MFHATRCSSGTYSAAIGVIEQPQHLAAAAKSFRTAVRPKVMLQLLFDCIEFAVLDRAIVVADDRDDRMRGVFFGNEDRGI